MSRMPSRAGVVVATAVALLTACMTYDPYTGEREVSKTTKGAVIGGAAGAATGLIWGDDHRERRKVTAGTEGGVARFERVELGLELEVLARRPGSQMFSRRHGPGPRAPGERASRFLKGEIEALASRGRAAAAATVPTPALRPRVTAIVDGGTAGTTITNTAAVTAADQSDGSPGNDSDSVDITIPAADLTLVKTVSDSTPDEGQAITYTVTLDNDGPDDATGVDVTDVLPSGVTFQSAVASQGSYDDGTGVWTVGSIAASAADTLTITATVDAGTAGQTIITSAGELPPAATPDQVLALSEDGSLAGVA